MTEPWEMTPEEMLATGKAYEASNRRESWDRWLAHDAAVRAREETAKEIGEWLTEWTGLDDKGFYKVNPDFDTLFQFIAALKAGKP